MLKKLLNALTSGLQNDSKSPGVLSSHNITRAQQRALNNGTHVEHMVIDAVICCTKIAGLSQTTTTTAKKKCNPKQMKTTAGQRREIKKNK